MIVIANFVLFKRLRKKDKKLDVLFFYKHTHIIWTIDRILFSGLSKVIPLSFLSCVVFPVSAQVIRDSFPAMEIVFNLKDTLRLCGTLPLMEEKRTIPGFKNKQTLFYIAMKTNILYDVLLVPNIGMGFYVWRNWSFAGNCGNWMYAWWKSDRRHNYWRTYGGDVEISLAWLVGRGNYNERKGGRW